MRPAETSFARWGPRGPAEPLRAIVVGSGIGGSAAAALLAHAGIPTTLVEKNRRLGGSCAGYDKQGFRIDIGTHMFCRGPVGPIGEVLRRVGRDGAIDFRRTHDIAEVRVVDRTRSGEILRVTVPAELYRMPRFVWEGARALGLTAREVARVSRMFAHILSMSPDEIDSWNDRTVEELVSRYTDHGPTIGMFAFLLGLYFILPYWEVSAGEAVWSFQNMVRDNWLSYPMGGSRAVPETYCKIAREHGAEVRTGCAVRRILVERGEVRGVELVDGTTLGARIVVSTSSLKTTVGRLVGEEHFPGAYVDRVRAIRGSYIAVQAKIGLKRKLVSAGAIVGGVGADVDLLRMSTDDIKATYANVATGRVPAVVPYYCPVPTNFDPGLAPPGCQLLTVCAVAPTSDIPLVDPGPEWEEAMLRTMRLVVPGLEDEALFIDRFSVPFIERWIGKELGPAVSTGQTPGQVADKRPKVWTPVRGLYVAGCAAGARGVGTELAAASAIECVDRILADLGREPPAARPAGALDDATARLFASVAWATRAS